MNVGPSATPGEHTLTVRATGTGVTDATATFSLLVQETPAGDFAIALDPGALTLLQGEEGTTP